MAVYEKQLELLTQQARSTHSSALVVLQDGQRLTEEIMDGLGDRPIETMSVTKSVVSLLVGRAMTLGYFDSVDVPISDYFPEWRQGQKRGITLRHLLTHTSGLQNVPQAGEELYPSHDFVQLALCAELSHAPGTAFAYNNKAVNLIMGFLGRASGRAADQFAADELFAPLGIDQWSWQKDPAGTPHAMSGLQLRATDLARLGQLALDDGRWQGETLIDPRWIEASTHPATPVTDAIGLLWWMLPAWTHYEVTEDNVANVETAGGTTAQLASLRATIGTYQDRSALMRRMSETGLIAPALPAGSRWMTTSTGPLVGFRHDGWRGQHLIVHRPARLVVVRLIAYDHPHVEADGSSFDTIIDQVVQLASTVVAST
ncbi:serine hydrolase domain-containing protein [Deinococcus ruber]|uniref:Beta-lactamase-related domain-containing protein n=1 Tax=Deinococcus ruber TaxID=1848197 RepID=A0A918C714_9DEIO|nr:serine hydrolase domain-containing protein [Deinococcus ruber]GGR09933.1 hypothetical protein GCM10008957_23380 [Deinococcus ruber]